MGDPLAQMRGKHLPFEPLWNAARASNQEQFAGRLGLTRRTVVRWKREGVPLLAADDAAVCLGRMPADIWGDDWDAPFVQHGYNESGPAVREHPGPCPTTSLEGARSMDSTS